MSQVVSRWSTGLDSGKTFWTDANGREMMVSGRPVPSGPTDDPTKKRMRAS